MRKILISFLFCTVLAAIVCGQSYTFKNYTTHDGLVQTNITAIKQDKRGNIWIGTNGGISIYDGKKFTNYDDQDILQSLRINAFFCDRAGVMWIATGSGLLKYDNRFQPAFSLPEAHDNSVKSLTSNTQNELFFVCNKNVYHINANGAVEQLRLNTALENDVAFIAFDREDNLWIVKTDLNIYKKAGHTLTPIHTPFTDEYKKRGLGMIRIQGREGASPYFVTNMGTFFVENDSLQAFYKQRPTYSRAGIGAATYIMEADDSTVWVGGIMGLAKLSESQTTVFTKKNGFCDNSVSCIFKDDENNIWVGCTYNGVYKLSNEALFHIKSPDESIDLRHISDIVPLPDQSTLLGTWGNGTFLIKEDCVSRLDFPNPRIRYITTMLSLPEQTYIGWFGSGLWKMNNKTYNLSPVPDFAKEEALYKMDKVLDHFIVQMLDGNCYLTDANFKIIASAVFPDENKVIVLKDKMYLTNPFGQTHLLDNKLQVIQKNLFPGISSRITELICYRDNFLIGTFGQGLFLFNQKGKLIKRLDKKNGLNTNIITSLLVDKNNLFVGTNLGLIRVGLPGLDNSKVFTENEGMFNWECREAGLKRLSNGSIFIATNNGPYIYFPDKDPAAQNTYGILTVSGFSYGKNADKHFFFPPLPGTVALPEAIDYSDNQICITLNGVSQRNPDAIVYHYQLAGYDTAWVTTKNGVINFSGLAPGDYTFNANISIGSFVSKPLTVTFTILKPLSGRLWFQVLLILLLSFIAWLLITLGNNIYQKYIETKMVSKLEADVAIKQKLTTQSIAGAQVDYEVLSEALRNAPGEKRLAYLTPAFLKEMSSRISILWENKKITVNEFHQYFDDWLAHSAPETKLYHKFSGDDVAMATDAVFHLLQLFSLYVITHLSENGASVFSLDSETKSNGRVWLRFYSVTHTAATQNRIYHFLKEAIDKQKKEEVTVDIIENLELGNLLIAEVKPYKTDQQ